MRRLLKAPTARVSLGEPVAESYSSISDLRMLILNARQRQNKTVKVPAGAWAEPEEKECMLPSEGANRSYRSAVELAGTLVATTSDARKLFEILDVLSDDPMKDIGKYDLAELRQRCNDKLLDQFRTKVHSRAIGFGV